MDHVRCSPKVSKRLYATSTFEPSANTINSLPSINYRLFLHVSSQVKHVR